ncbi:GIY-YIG nuclease family protein [Bradyrhizobium elkanii]
MAIAFQSNGPSLFVDTYLRKFLLEYTNRIFHGRGNEQPVSFNVMRAFVTPDEKAMVLRLLDEKFFQFNLLDYLDFVTSASLDPKIALRDFDELTIYELNNAGSFAQVVLPGFENLVFCGAAIVREGTEFSIMGVFGNRRSLFVEGPEIDPSEIRPQKREFIGDGPWDQTAEALFDNEAYYPLIALTRVDVGEKLIHAQYILHETKQSFRITTDDPDVMLDVESYRPGADIDAALKNAVAELARHGHVFNLLNNLLHFPQFMSKREDDFYVERHPTQLKIEPQTTRVRKMRAALEPRYCPNFRDVLTLAQSEDPKPSSALDPTDLKFETSGYWRALGLDKSGADKSGNHIYGKTWVERRLSWREVENAKADARQEKTSVVRMSRADDVGYVYIMRSPAHERNVYKIGFTTRDPEDRANDLSSTSGQPDALVVMQSWKVFEPRRVEQEIHRRLEQLRINSRREFFKANFQMLRQTIEQIIAQLDASAP